MNGNMPFVDQLFAKEKRTLPVHLLRRKTSASTTYPLSVSQQRLWFLDQLDAEKPVYNIPIAARLDGALYIDVLQHSLNAIVERHTILRTTFAMREEQPIQLISPLRALPLPICDLSGLPVAEREAAALGMAYTEARRPFDLGSDLLVRAMVLRLNTNQHLLVLTMHHIAADGWSLGVFFRELGTLYAAYLSGETPVLPDLPIRYVDFALWQRRWLGSPALHQSIAYWRRQLAGAPALLELPSDRPRPPVQTFRGAEEPLVVPRELTAALRQLCQGQGVTLSVMLLAAFQTLLFRSSGQDDIVVGSPIAGRVRADVENLIGLFVNTLLLRTSLSGDPPFCELLERVRGTVLDAYAHQSLPFERLVEELQPERNLGYNPLFQVEFILEQAPQPMRLTGLASTPVEISNGTSKFDLSLSLAETTTELAGVIEYNTDLFDRTTIQRWIGQFQTLLAGIVAHPSQRVSQLPLLSAAELEELLVVRNRTAASYPRERCLHHFVEEQVARTPNTPAAVFGDATLSYGELDARANQLARYLQLHGAGRGSRVGVCLERSCELLVALLGIFKAGAAFVPLDPAFPKERMAYIIEDAQISLLLTHERLRPRIPGFSGTIVGLDAAWPSISAAPASAPSSVVSGDDLAYLIYTSGSTGRPKGVLIPHAGIVNYLVWCAEAYHAAAGRGAPVHASIAADAIFPSLFAPLLVGACVYFYPEEQALDALGNDLVNQGGFSFIKITPSQLEVLNYRLPAADARGWVDTLVVGAEAVRSEVLRFWHAHAPTMTLLNEYGPTETVVGCSIYPMPPGTQFSGAAPIGLPIANLRFYVLDAAMQPVPIGVPGELYIGGAGVAWGYLNRPDLTAEKFVPDPFSGEAGARLYRSGDVARYLSDRTANIAFLGRSDDQVKVRGYRVELGEIESLLERHAGVREAAVLAREDRQGGVRLVAYVVAEAGVAPDAEELRRYLQAWLPEYMLPTAFVALEQMPLAPHGKIDRHALPTPELAGPHLVSYVPPRTALETQVAAIWADVLGCQRVGIHDNFFELGGHSLLATRVMSRVCSTCGLNLPLRSLFETPTVAGLAEQIVQQQLARTNQEVLAQLLAEIERLPTHNMSIPSRQSVSSNLEGKL
jgi:amino acid adenylation domain-containing protein